MYEIAYAHSVFYDIIYDDPGQISFSSQKYVPKFI